jgi:hypothetical protein
MFWIDMPGRRRSVVGEDEDDNPPFPPSISSISIGDEAVADKDEAEGEQEGDRREDEEWETESSSSSIASMASSSS